MAGLTSEGLSIKRLAEIKADIEARLKAELGPDVATGPTSVLGHLIGILAASLAESWEGLEGVAAAISPDAATGKALDDLAAIVGVQRQGATKARGQVTLTGTAGVTVPAGKTVKSSSSGLAYVTASTVVIGVGGTVDVEVEAEEEGAGTVEDVDTIVTPVPGWTAVGSTVALEDGTDAETDSALRIRRQASLQIIGAGADNAIRARVLEIDEVTACVVISNRTMAEVDGQAAKSFRVIVWPTGLAAETTELIAQTIWEVQPAGIASEGAEVYEVTDSQGYTQTVRFDYAAPVELYVKVTLTTNTRYPSDGEAQVQAAIRAVFQGVDETTITTAQELALFNVAGAGLGVGDDVTLLKLACAVATVPGVVSAAFLVDLVDPPVLATDYAIARDEIAALAADATVVVA